MMVKNVEATFQSGWSLLQLRISDQITGFGLWEVYPLYDSSVVVHQHECKRVQGKCIELTIELNVQVSDFPHKASRSRSFLRTT